MSPRVTRDNVRVFLAMMQQGKTIRYRSSAVGDRWDDSSRGYSHPVHGGEYMDEKKKKRWQQHKREKYSLQAGADAAEVISERSSLSNDRRTLVTVAQRTTLQLEHETAGSNDTYGTAQNTQRNKRVNRQQKKGPTGRNKCSRVASYSCPAARSCDLSYIRCGSICHRTCY